MQYCAEKPEREIFELRFPTHLLTSMAMTITERGKLLFRRDWEVNVADVWVFFCVYAIHDDIYTEGCEEAVL